MGNISTSQRAAHMAKNRRYSQASNYVLTTDHIRDKKSLKIDLRHSTEDSGTFTLTYTDSSTDAFLSLDCTFTYTGTYRVVDLEENHDVDGVSMNVSPRGNIILPYRELKEDNGDQQKSQSMRNDDHALTNGAFVTTETIVRRVHFRTEQVICRLSDGKPPEQWTITPNEDTDCLETTTEERQKHVSWTFSGEPALVVEHTAPSFALDFSGEELFESSGKSYIDLRWRVPQLCAHEDDLVLRINEKTGWKLRR